MTKNGWILFSIMCAALLGGLVFISQREKADVSGIDVSKVQGATVESGNIADHTYGNMTSKVVLIEYGDFQCPGCGSAHPVVKKIIEKYKDKMGFVFRNFPLTTIHPNALAASAAAEAAGLQGKYWEMHDALYENQGSWKDLTGQERTDAFKRYALNVGANEDTWLKDLDSVAVQKKISFDTALGKKAEVTGTPSFFLNGKNVGNHDVKDGKLIPSDNDNSTPTVWSNATYFEDLVIKPALKEAGIAIE